MGNVKILTEGDTSMLIVFGEEISPLINAKIASAVRLMKQQKIEGIVDIIPSFAALLINYNPQVVSYGTLKKRMQAILSMDLDTQEAAKRVFEIPVCYGGEFGPDLENIAQHAGLSCEEVVEIHSSCDYLIYMLGFLPGFCISAVWTSAFTRRAWRIRDSVFRRGVSASAAPRRVFIPWIRPADGS